LWAAQLGGRARWLVPASFVGVMIVGATLAMSGLHVPFPDEGILLSVLVLGILITVAARFPLAASMAVVGLFAFFTDTRMGRKCPSMLSASRTARALSWPRPPCTDAGSDWPLCRNP
ncbi:MAG TPA: HupE/UreJ family protein, partial [Verrucomicrobiae bacterium]|nr:HupE/UreJ family protein [Verrucomicrobiae bacterium]